MHKFWSFLAEWIELSGLVDLTNRGLEVESSKLGVGKIDMCQVV